MLLCARRTGGSPLGRSVRLARGAGARGASTSTSSSAAPAITNFVRPIAATIHARARLLPLQVAPACRSSYSAGCGPANIVPSIFAFAAYIALAVLPSIKNFVRSPSRPSPGLKVHCRRPRPQGRLYECLERQAMRNWANRVHRRLWGEAPAAGASASTPG